MCNAFVLFSVGFGFSGTWRYNAVYCFLVFLAFILELPFCFNFSLFCWVVSRLCCCCCSIRFCTSTCTPLVVMFFFFCDLPVCSMHQNQFNFLLLLLVTWKLSIFLWIVDVILFCFSSWCEWCNAFFCKWFFSLYYILHTHDTHKSE